MLNKLLFKLFAAALLLTQLFCFTDALAQTVSLTSAPGNAGQSGLSDSPLYPQNNVVMYGIRITVSGGSRTITEISIPSAFSNTSTLFTNGRLVRSTTNSYNSGSVTQVAGIGTVGTAVNIGTNNITITGLSENLTNTQMWYYLVLDYTYTGTDTHAANVFTNPTVTHSGGTTSAYAGSPYYSLRPVSLDLDDVSGGLTPNGTIYPQNSTVLYGFRASTPGGSATVTQFAISGTNTSLSTYFSNAKLYRSSSSSYNGSAVQIAGAGVGGTTGVVNAGNITFTGLSETINTSPDVYYYVMLDYSYTGTSNSSVQFHTIAPTFNTGGSGSYPNNHGPSYNLNATSVTVNNITGGLTSNSAAFVPGQTDLKLFGFSVNVIGTTTINSFNINSFSASSTPNNYLTNGKLYVSNNSSYDGTAVQIAGAGVGGTAVTFNGAFVNVTGISQSFSSGTSPGITKYYYLIADYGAYTGTTPGTVRFRFTNGQSSAAIVQTSPAVTFNNFAQDGTLYNFNGNSFSVANLSGGLSSTALLLNQTNIALFGFSLTGTGVSTLSQIAINSNNANLGGYFTNFRLYRNTTNTYGTGTPTQVGTAAVSGNFVVVTGLSESFASTSGQVNNYFLVADYTSTTGTLPGSVQFNFTNAQSTAALTQNSPNSTTYNNFTVNTGNTYTMNNAAISLSSQQNGLAATTIYGGQSNLAVFGFGVAVTGTSNITGININSNNGSLSTYIGNVRLYSNTTNSYTTGSPALVATGSISGSYVNFTGLIGQSISNTTRYYFLVVDNIYTGTNSSSVTFNFTSGQGTNALVQSTPSSSYNTFNVTGTAFTLSPTSISMAGLNGGIAGSDLYYGDVNKAVFGFSITAAGTPTVTNINLQSSNSSLSTYFTGKLFRNSTNTYGSGTATQVGTVAFNGSNVNVTGLTESFANGETKNYFLVVDDIYYHATNQPQVQFSINYGQTIVVLSSGQSFNTINYIGTGTYTLKRPAPTLTVTGINGAINGITQGSISYGQTNIVLFGFKVQALGVLTISEIRIQSTLAADAYFTNGKLYRSTTPYFSNATQVSGNFAFNAQTTISSMNEAYTTYASPTTYYYFVVADLTAQTYLSPGTFTYNFTNGQTTFIQSASPYTSFNNISTTNGNPFVIVNTVKWTGQVSQSFSDASNFKDLSGNNTSVPGSGTVVQIGVAAYTNAPIISSGTTIGGFTFGTQSTPTVTINSGITVNMDRQLNTINATTATITGGGAINITNTANSTIGVGSTLNLNNVSLSNAGTFTAAPTSVINLTNNATIANTGTFTLASNINGTAAIGQLSGTSAVTGNVITQRYISGGTAAFRGYRLFSSPVYRGTVGGNNVYGVSFTKGSAYITGTTGTAGGFDATAATPTIYLYREDKTPSSSPIGGNFRGVNKINNTPNYDLGIDNESTNFNLPVGNGFMFFFRGDRATNSSTSTAAIPDPVIFSDTGTLNRGDIDVKLWYTPNSTTLGRVNTRYHLVGNPYPSTIDWNTFSSSNSAAAIYGPSLNGTVYIYNAESKNYATYDGLNGTNNGGRYIPSGQGFYVFADETGTASLKFTEGAKVASQQVLSSNLLMATSITPETVDPQYLKLQLKKDDLSKEDLVVRFDKSATGDYLFGEDSPYFQGSGAVSFYSKSANNISLAINELPLLSQNQTIPLYAGVNATGIYQLNLTEAKNIPKMFDVWLMDAYKKDSLDIKHNATYNFNANTADVASYGANRFSLVIRRNAAYSYHLLDFAAAKQSTAVQLNWKAENEENYTYFTVERSTDGGKNFEVIGSVAGNNSSTYSVLDKAPATGENQYRLKQEDYFGTVTYTKIIPIMYTPIAESVADGRLVSVYPNPTSVNLNVSVKNNAATNSALYSISFTNTSGRIIKTISSAQANWQGNISDLLPGTYFIQVVNKKDNSVVGRSTFIKL